MCFSGGRAACVPALAIFYHAIEAVADIGQNQAGKLEVGFAFFPQRAAIVVGIFLKGDAATLLMPGFTDFNFFGVNPCLAIGKKAMDSNMPLAADQVGMG